MLEIVVELWNVVVTELSDQISSLEDDKKELQDEIKILTQKCDELKERCERLTIERLERMPIEEHLASIEECHRLILSKIIN